MVFIVERTVDPEINCWANGNSVMASREWGKGRGRKMIRGNKTGE